MKHQVIMNENLTFYKSNQNVSLCMSAVIHQGVLLKFVIFKNFPKMVIFGFIGHAKFNFIIKI